MINGALGIKRVKKSIFCAKRDETERMNKREDIVGEQMQ